MDYTKSNWKFKLKKALRYIRLYGLTRTWIKVQGQYHMKKQYATLPELTFPLEKGGHVGLIGCGNFAFSNIAYYLKKNYGHVIRGAMDIDIHKAASIYENYGLKYYTDDPGKIITDPDIDLIYIASNHATHTDYAIQALQVGKNVHIEKPHVVGRYVYHNRPSRQTSMACSRSHSAFKKNNWLVFNIGFDRSCIPEGFKTLTEQSATI